MTKHAIQIFDVDTFTNKLVVAPFHTTADTQDQLTKFVVEYKVINGEISFYNNIANFWLYRFIESISNST